MTDGWNNQFWNLEQVLVWVYLRDRELVARAANSRENQEIQRVNAFEMILTAHDQSETAKPNLRAARRDIIAHLQSGELTAHGRPYGKGDIQEIPKKFWIDADFFWEPTLAAPANIFKMDATHWHDLNFEKVQVLSIWPDPIESADISTIDEPRSTAGRRTHKSTKIEKADKAFAALVEANSLTFERGELTKIGTKIAEEIGYKPNSVIKAIRGLYKQEKAKRKAGKR